MTISIGEIWKEFSNSLKRFIITRVRNEHDVEDILQDIFYKICKNIDSLKDENKVQSWVYQITRNAIIDYYRLRKDTIGFGEMPGDIMDGSTDDIKIDSEILPCLQPMIGQLPEKYRQAIILTEFEGLTQKELAEKCGLSLSGAKSRVQRGREKLKEMLLECCYFEFDCLGNILDYRTRENTCSYCTGESPCK